MRRYVNPKGREAGGRSGSATQTVERDQAEPQATVMRGDAQASRGFVAVARLRAH